MRTAAAIAVAVVIAIVTAGLAVLGNEPETTCRDVLREAYLQGLSDPTHQAATERPAKCAGQIPEPDMTLGRTHVWQPKRIIELHEKRPRPGTSPRGTRPTPSG